MNPNRIETDARKARRNPAWKCLLGRKQHACAATHHRYTTPKEIAERSRKGTFPFDFFHNTGDLS